MTVDARPLAALMLALSMVGLVALMPLSGVRRRAGRERAAAARAQPRAGAGGGGGHEAAASGRRPDRAVDRGRDRRGQGEMHRAACRHSARLSAARPDQRGSVRGAGADPGQVHRQGPGGRDRSAGHAHLSARACAGRLAPRHRAARRQGVVRGAGDQSCTTPPPMPAAIAMARRKGRSASTRSPMRSTSPNSCSPRARPLRCSTIGRTRRSCRLCPSPSRPGSR